MIARRRLQVVTTRLATCQRSRSDSIERLEGLYGNGFSTLTESLEATSTDRDGRLRAAGGRRGDRTAGVGERHGCRAADLWCLVRRAVAGRPRRSPPADSRRHITEARS